MLLSVDGVEMRDIPRNRKADFEKWKNALAAKHGTRAHSMVVKTIHGRIGDAQYINSSWLGSQDWDGTPLQWLWEVVGENDVLGGFFFGLMVWETMIGDEDSTWVFYRPDNPDSDPEAKKMGMYYWRKN